MNISSDHGKTLSALKNLKAAFPKGKTALLAGPLLLSREHPENNKSRKMIL
jgi:hypothetical protein